MIITDRGGTAIPTPSGTTLHLVYCSNGRGSSGGGGSDDDGDDGRSIDILCFAHTRPSRGDNKQKKKKSEHHNNIYYIYIHYAGVYICTMFYAQQLSLPTLRHVHISDYHNPHIVIIIS